MRIRTKCIWGLSIISLAYASSSYQNVRWVSALSAWWSFLGTSKSEGGHQGHTSVYYKSRMRINIGIVLKFVL